MQDVQRFLGLFTDNQAVLWTGDVRALRVKQDDELRCVHQYIGEHRKSLRCDIHADIHITPRNSGDPWRSVDFRKPRGYSSKTIQVHIDHKPLAYAI